VQNDIKRVVAYSTLSQLGYMTAARGASAYSAGVFPLLSHAFFKALLFLAAGSVIIGMHHDQDIRNMGGLRKYMPVTWITSLIGSLALIGTPFFAGFYSKDSIILAVENSNLGWISVYAKWAVLLGVFVTAFYSFRMYFLVFHGEERFRNKPFPAEQDHAADDAHDDPNVVHTDDPHAAQTDDHRHDAVHVPHESPAVVWGPLVALAIPSVLIGGLAIGPMLGGHFFDGAVLVNLGRHPAMEHVAEHAEHAVRMGWNAFLTLPFWLAALGVAAASYFYYFRKPSFVHPATGPAAMLRRLLENKYYLDAFNEKVLARLTRGLGMTLWTVGDKGIIDGAAVNGSAMTVGWMAGIARRVQTGFLYSYAFWMVIGLALMLGWFLVGAR